MEGWVVCDCLPLCVMLLLKRMPLMDSALLCSVAPIVTRLRERDSEHGVREKKPTFK